MSFNDSRRQLLVALCASPMALLPIQVMAESEAARAHRLHFSSIVAITHSDTPMRLLNRKINLAERDVEGQVDIPRMREGGMNCVFFSIYINRQVEAWYSAKTSDLVCY